MLTGAGPGDAPHAPEPKPCPNPLVGDRISFGTSLFDGGAKLGRFGIVVVFEFVSRVAHGVIMALSHRGCQPSPWMGSGVTDKLNDFGLTN